MKDKLNSVLNKLMESFNDKSEGFSSRKLTSFAMTVCIIVLHAEWMEYSHRVDDFNLLPTVLTIDTGFILVLLGLTTYSKAQDIKNKKDDDKKS